MTLPNLSQAHWPDSAYRRQDLPERVPQFGTGMLLRALCAASVLEHEWRVILTNQEMKMRIRVVPLIGAFTSRFGRVPEGLALACAAHLTCLGLPVAALAEVSQLPSFVEAARRWRLVIEQDRVEGALVRD